MKNRGRAQSPKLSWHEIGFICEGMSLASRPIRIATKRVSAEHSLGPRGAWMLLLIATGEVFAMDLTKIFQVGRSLITAELNRLSDAKLITYRQSALDGRRMELALTPLGQSACERVKADTAKLVLERLKGYTRAEVLLCARMLRDFRIPDTPDVPAEYERSRLKTAQCAVVKPKRGRRATT